MSYISIICTVKNGEKTIIDTLNSVINQSLKEWEFIIVDDGSVDNTFKILKEFESNDNRIRIIKTPGIGRGKALNLAIKASKGNYIANIDADDLMHPKKLAIQTKILNEHPKLFLLCSKHKIIHDDESVYWDEVPNENIKLQNISKQNYKKNQVEHSSVVMEKDTLIKIGCYDENRKSQFDYELWLRSAYKGYELECVNLRLVAKRIHSGQSFESKRLGQLVRSVTLQMKYIMKIKQFTLIVYPIGRLFLGILPFNIRQKINKKIKV